MIRSALLLLALAACAPTPASGVVAPAAPTIQVADTGYVNVTGTGTVAVEPDLARISFAVESESADARSAVRDNADLMTAVMAALRGAYSDVEIETHGYSLQPRYTRPDRDGQREVSGYTVLNHVRVTVDEIDRVGALIDAATGAGANRVASLSFGSGDLEDAREEALRRADALGVALGSPLEVHTNNPQTPMFEDVRAMASMVAAQTPIEPGDQTVRVTVTVRYRLGGQ